MKNSLPKLTLTLLAATSLLAFSAPGHAASTDRAATNQTLQIASNLQTAEDPQRIEVGLIALRSAAQFDEVDVEPQGERDQ